MTPTRSGPTPPTIVRDAERPSSALGAFIAQELEHWGFDVQPIGASTNQLAVRLLEGWDLRITIERRKP